jgi:hypothetical protein
MRRLSKSAKAPTMEAEERLLDIVREAGFDLR